jgi:cytidylate kinase
MPIITISRGSYSRGKEVAEKLALKLGYDCVSRDIFLEASTEFNIPEIKLVRALHDAPTVLERFSFGKERYLAYLRSALLQHVLKDNVVYHGLAGHYFLQDIPHVLKTRIIADFEDRVREEMKRENISEAEARHVLKKDDEERRKWGLQIYGIDTWDPSLYDMVLHVSRLTVDDAVNIIAQTVQKPVFRTTPTSQKILSNRALSAKVLANLIPVAPKISVTSEDGVVFITNANRALSWTNDDISEIKTLSAKVEGVKEVILNDITREPAHQTDHINPFHNIG